MSSHTPIAERIAFLQSSRQRTAGPCLPDSDDLIRALGRILSSQASRQSPKLRHRLRFLDQVCEGLEKAGLYS